MNGIGKSGEKAWDKVDLWIGTKWFFLRSVIKLQQVENSWLVVNLHNTESPGALQNCSSDYNRDGCFWVATTFTITGGPWGTLFYAIYGSGSYV